MSFLACYRVFRSIMVGTGESVLVQVLKAVCRWGGAVVSTLWVREGGTVMGIRTAREEAIAARPYCTSQWFVGCMVRAMLRQASVPRSAIHPGSVSFHWLVRGISCCWKNENPCMNRTESIDADVILELCACLKGCLIFEVPVRSIKLPAS